MFYHVINKSIAGFKIFNTEKDYLRMIMAVCYYQKVNLQICLGEFLRTNKNERNKEKDILTKIISLSKKKQKLVEIVAYCLMPTHLHLLLKESKEKGISVFMKNALDSYTRYFNIKHKRKGPLWEGRSKKVLIETDEQLLHMTRYIHLNPVTAHLIDKPEQWLYSSYKEYISKVPESKRICKYDDILDIEPHEYKKFVEGRISYQRELAKIKDLYLE